MGVGEEHPGGGQAIQVRGLGLRMPGEATDPVIEIVDRDEQYVWAIGCMDGGGHQQANQSPFDDSTFHWGTLNRTRGNRRKAGRRRWRSYRLQGNTWGFCLEL